MKLIRSNSATTLILAVALGVGSACGAVAKDEPKGDGVKVGEASSFRKLVSAESIEKQATQQYAALKRDTAAKQALAPDNHRRRSSYLAACLMPKIGA